MSSTLLRNRPGASVASILAPHASGVVGQVDADLKGKFTARILTNGTSQIIGSYEYFTFTQGGTFDCLSNGDAEVLVVAGGGGGGSNNSGGGGGGIRTETVGGATTYVTLKFGAGQVSTVLVGNGGSAPGDGVAANGGAGGNSSVSYAFGTLSATGGGFGSQSGTGGSGGSGGGASGTGGTGNIGGYTPREGWNGSGGGSPNGIGGGGGWNSATSSGNGSQGLTVNNIDANLSTILGYTVVSSGGGCSGNCNAGGTNGGGGSGAGTGGYGNNAGNASSYGSGGGGGNNCFGAVYHGGTGRQGVVVVRIRR